MSGPSTSTPGSTMSSTLWAHLLNKDAAASGSGLKPGLVTSVGPSASAFADRAGTSVRILLHDTQATIEKFSERVDKLISEAEDSRQKLLARNEEVNDEVERLIRRVVQEQVGRTETVLQSHIREPAQAPVLAELRQSISSSLDALNQKIETVQSLAHINTQALQTIKDQQLQILTAIVPLLPMLQKVPLHIASTEANLKEAISISLAPIASTRLTNTSSTSDSKKRKLSKAGDQHTPSPTARRRRTGINSSHTAHQQLPSPKSSGDFLLTRGGVSTANHYGSASDALRSGSRRPSRSTNTVQTPDPGQRLSMQPVSLSERSALPLSSLSHKKRSALDTSVTLPFARPISSAHSVTPAPSYHLNDPTGALNVPSRSNFHTPLHTGSKHPNDQPTRPSAPPPSSIGFPARRGKRFIPIADDDDDDDD